MTELKNNRNKINYFWNSFKQIVLLEHYIIVNGAREHN